MCSLGGFRVGVGSGQDCFYFDPRIEAADVKAVRCGGERL